jgi:hypothetical protein
VIVGFANQRLGLISSAHGRLNPNQHHGYAEFLSFNDPLPNILIAAHQVDSTDGPIAGKDDEVTHNPRVHTLLAAMHHSAKTKLESTLVCKAIVLWSRERIYGSIVPVGSKVLLTGVLLAEVDESRRDLDRVEQQVAPERSAVAEISGGCEEVSSVYKDYESVHSLLQEKAGLLRDPQNGAVRPQQEVLPNNLQC